MELLLLVGFGVAVLYNQAKQFQKDAHVELLKVRFDFKKSAFTLFSQLYFTTTVKLINPTDFSIKLSRIRLTVKPVSNGIAGKVADVDLQQPIEIKKNASENYVVPCVIYTASFFSSLKDAINKFKAGQPIPVTMVGSVNTTVGELKFSKDVILNEALS